jgi:enamine deaminase RidA (YjgF/YER057c/UK114 family)
MIATAFNAPGFPPSEGYSSAVEIRESRRTVFTTGQVGMRPDGSIPVDPRAQIQLALDNFRSLIEAMGLSTDNVVKYTFYLRDIAHYELLQSIFGPVMTSSGVPAAATMVVVKEFGLPELILEFDVVLAD